MLILKEGNSNSYIMLVGLCYFIYFGRIRRKGPYEKHSRNKIFDLLYARGIAYLRLHLIFDLVYWQLSLFCFS